MSVALDAIFGAVIGLSLSIWPGEGLTRTVRGVVRGGVRGSLAGGVLAADLLAISVLGALLLSGCVHSWVATIAQILAGLVLVILGWRLMEDRTPGAVHRDRAADHIRSWSVHPFLDRFLATVLTPRWIVLWSIGGIGLLLGSIGTESREVAGVAAFAAGLVGAGLLARGGIALLLVRPGREWAVSDRVFRIVTALCGLGIVAVGVVVGLRAVDPITGDHPLNRIVENVFR